MKFKTKEDLENSIKYITQNFSGFYTRCQKQGNTTYLVLDPNAQTRNLVIEHSSQTQLNFNQFRDKFQIGDSEKQAELHVFNDNQLVMITSHCISDSRQQFQYLKAIETKRMMRLSIPDNIYELFKSQYYELQGTRHYYYQISRQNSYEVIDDHHTNQKMYTECVQLKLKDYPQLQHRLSQKLIIINALYKLYILQRRNRIRGVEYLLQNGGISIMQQYVLDGRQFIDDNHNFGSCELSMFENFVLYGEKTIEWYTYQMMKQFEEKVRDYQHVASLQIYENVINQRGQKVSNKVVTGFQFQNVGQYKSDYFQNVELDFSFRTRELGKPHVFVFTFNDQLNINYHFFDEYKNYNTQRIIRILLHYMKDETKIKDLWSRIQNL